MFQAGCILLIWGLVLLQHCRSLLMFQAGCILLLHHTVRHLLSLHACWLVNILLGWRRQHFLLFTNSLLLLLLLLLFSLWSSLASFLWLGQILIILAAVLGNVGLNNGQLLVEMIVRVSAHVVTRVVAEVFPQG